MYNIYIYIYIMDTEIIVAIIGASAVVIGPIVGIIIKKCCGDPDPPDPPDPPPPPPPPPPPNPPCQILSTPVLRIAGIPFTNNARCEEQRMKCEMCGKFFCPYHHEINRDNSPNGGHICQPSQP
jgi:hypothetical protein